MARKHRQALRLDLGPYSTAILLGIVAVSLVLSSGCTLCRQDSMNQTLAIFGGEMPFMQHYQLCLDSPGFGVPAGGIKIAHPKSPGVLFYHTLRQLLEKQPQRETAAHGLWVSRDGGQTWHKVPTDIADFEWLFIHPRSGMFFASVISQPFRMLADRVLVTETDCRIVTSMDGITWKDISPNVGRNNMYGPICLDPDKPDRVCAYQTYPLPHKMLQAKNERYEDWNSFTLEEWSAHHKEWDWNAFFKNSTVGPETEDHGEPMLPQRKVPR